MDTSQPIHKIEMESSLDGLDHASVAGHLAWQLRQLPADFRRLAHDDVTLWDIIGWLEEVEEFGHPHTHDTFDEVLDELRVWAKAHGLDLQTPGAAR